MKIKENTVLLEKEIKEFSALLDKNNINAAYKIYGFSLLYSLPENERINYSKSLGFELTDIEHYNLGVKAVSEGNLKEAVKEFKQAVKLNPGHLGSYYNLGLAYEELGEKTKAGEFFNEYINLYEKISQSKNSFLDEVFIPFQASEKEFIKEAKNRLKS
ncbi:tetratricopeptide repeat protein [Candidatus Desantisbacteria bacterium]|nr:tetratricopeptide repeat protein [Candidatus Desantisbacteria bacterium]